MTLVSNPEFLVEAVENTNTAAYKPAFGTVGESSRKDPNATIS